MPSLKAINDTMNKVEEYTEETSVSVNRLDRNFEKWFEQQRRSALDAEEDRREAKKAMAAMGAAGRAGQSGNQDQQRGSGPGVLASIAAALAALPPTLKMALGITAGVALYKTGRFAYRTATMAPLREFGERMGQGVVNRAEQRRTIRLQREINRQRAEEEKKIEQVREQAREQALAERREARLRIRAAQGDRSYIPSNEAMRAATVDNLPTGQVMSISPGQNFTAANVDTSPGVAKSYDPVSQKFVKPDMPALNAKDIIPELITSTNRVRLTDVVVDGKTIAKINKVEADNKVRISVTPDGKIDIRSADPSKLGAFVSKDVFNKTMIELTTPEAKSAAPKGDGRSVKGTAAALGFAGLVLEGGDIAQQTFMKTGSTSVIPKYGSGGSYSTTAGALTMGAASEVARLPGDLIDLSVLGWMSLTGQDGQQTNIGETIAEKVFYSAFAERIKQQGGIVDFSGVGGQTVLGTAKRVSGAAETAVDSLVAGLQLVSGMSPQEIKDDILTQSLSNITSIDDTGSVNTGNLTNQVATETMVSAFADIVNGLNASQKANTAAAGSTNLNFSEAFGNATNYYHLEKMANAPIGAVPYSQAGLK